MKKIYHGKKAENAKEKAKKDREQSWYDHEIEIVPPEEMLALLNKVSGNLSYKDQPRDVPTGKNKVADGKEQDLLDERKNLAVHKQINQIITEANERQANQEYLAKIPKPTAAFKVMTRDHVFDLAQRAKLTTPDAQKYSPYFHCVESASPCFVMDRSERLKNQVTVAGALTNCHQVAKQEEKGLPIHRVCKNIPQTLRSFSRLSDDNLQTRNSF